MDPLQAEGEDIRARRDGEKLLAVHAVRDGTGGDQIPGIEVP
jgi:hypothetical protein